MKKLVLIFLAFSLLASCKTFDQKTADYRQFEGRDKVIEIEVKATNYMSNVIKSSYEEDGTLNSVDYSALLFVEKLDHPGIVNVFYPMGYGEEVYSPTEHKYVKRKHKAEPDYFKRYLILLKNKRSVDEFRNKGIKRTFSFSSKDLQIVSEEGETYFIRGKVTDRIELEEERIDEYVQDRHYPAEVSYQALILDPSLMVLYVRKNGVIVSKEVLYDARRDEQ